MEKLDFEFEGNVGTVELKTDEHEDCAVRTVSCCSDGLDSLSRVSCCSDGFDSLSRVSCCSAGLD